MRKSYDAIYADYSAEFDEAAMYNERVRWADTGDGYLFVNDLTPWYGRYIPGKEVWTAKPGKNVYADVLRRIWDAALSNGKLARKTDSVQLPYREIAHKFETEGGTVCWIRNKFVKLFPSWASFYVQGPHDPVLVADYQADGLHVFGIVTPCIVNAAEIAE